MSLTALQSFYQHEKTIDALQEQLSFFEELSIVGKEGDNSHIIGTGTTPYLAVINLLKELEQEDNDHSDLFFPSFLNLGMTEPQLNLYLGFPENAFKSIPEKKEQDLIDQTPRLIRRRS